MTRRRTTAGRVGRAHGVDGSFHVEEPRHELALGTRVLVCDRATEVERRAGTDERPLIRLSEVDDPAAIRGELLLVDDELEEDEWLVEDLVGCMVGGLGEVRRVLEGPSCDVLEVGDDAVLVPFVSDAVRRVDVSRRVIEVDREFLGL